MPAFIGRRIVLTWDGTQIAGAQEKAVTFNGEAVDISDGASNGWRELLAEAGENSIDISISGVTKTDALKRAWFNSEDRIKPATLTYPDGGVLSGNFYLASFSETGPYKDKTTFEVELQSSGVVTYVPGA